MTAGNRVESSDKVARYRAEMAKLLRRSVATTRELERWLDFTGGWDEARVQLDLAGDETSIARVQYALLLRKARIHTDAVLQANETNNVHSLAVQMRPVLECVGQLAFISHNVIIAPGLTMEVERAVKVVGDYFSADYYGTVIRATKGQVGHKQLLEDIWRLNDATAASVGMPKPQRGKGKSLKQADKMAGLAGGRGLVRLPERVLLSRQSGLEGTLVARGRRLHEVGWGSVHVCQLDSGSGRTRRRHERVCRTVSYRWRRRARVGRGHAGATTRSPGGIQGGS